MNYNYVKIPSNDPKCKYIIYWHKQLLIKIYYEKCLQSNTQEIYTKMFTKISTKKCAKMSTKMSTEMSRYAGNVYKISTNNINLRIKTAY